METIEYETEQENLTYHANKKDRTLRALIYKRKAAMESHQDRLDAERDWEMADKSFRQYAPPRDADDWRANLVLPDAFAAIQGQAQETIDRKSRPELKRVEDSDKGKEKFGNAILTHNMDRTGFDYQTFMAKYGASIRGTTFVIERYRIDKREVMDPTSVDADGNLEYTKKEIIDADDTYTEFIENEWIQVDPAGTDIEDKHDCIIREILDIDEFHRIYSLKPDFLNVEFVKAGGDVSESSFFKLPEDMSEDQVEVLHYYNKVRDLYGVSANNVIIRNGPIPYKHKQLPITPFYFYRDPGKFWGIGIPKVIESLTEERTAIRRLRIDRQKMQINKMFLHNSQFDLDEEETVTRPHGIISVDTNGLPLNQVLQPLEYGDTPASAFKEDETLNEDIRRATGIDDRVTVSDSSTTATQAAIVKESTLKRINLISQLTEMDSLVRVGRLKWSNVQFFYPAPRIERVIEENEEREQKVYRTVTTEGQDFHIIKGDDGKNKLQINEIEGSFSFKLNKSLASYMEGDFDVIIDASAFSQISKPIQQAKITEMFTLLSSNPALLGSLDTDKSTARYIEINGEDPKNWLKGNGMSEAEWQNLAEKENLVMEQGVPLNGTKGASEAHTMVHLDYANSPAFHALPEAVQQVIQAHILEEHDANPATGSSADAMSQAAQGVDTSQLAAPAAPGNPFQPSPETLQPEGTNRQLQTADISPASPGLPRE